MNTRNTKNGRLNVRVEKEVEDWIERSARNKRMPVSMVVRGILYSAFEQRHSDRKRALPKGKKVM